ncbi:hypothetical protein [Pedobacter mendelii]|uniref:Anti sigma-E protein RseA N-terminal domain-containing protein n=1 Tax=Pedobacter mendelii TaxID=1908240 RepID=A0ABQ2BJ44_9SPHI|nr:hypothetical protein [Pedobacter mendelii]GGI27348.1 hypothetical protein GCM10008119_27210 [Pedobacter mendelii]
MNENLENNDWINEAPTLAAMHKRNPFSVPDGYFDNCEQDVLSEVFLNSLKQNTNQHVFEVPQNYFEDLIEMIETRIAIENSAQLNNSFAVPENYFETLQSRITDKIEAEQIVKKEAKIIPLWRKGFVKYASAACFILISSFGVYFYQNNQPADVVNVPQMQSADVANDQMLYDIDETTIIDHLEAQNTSIIKTTSASDTEVENYILSNYSSSDLAQEL